MLKECISDTRGEGCCAVLAQPGQVKARTWLEFARTMASDRAMCHFGATVPAESTPRAGTNRDTRVLILEIRNAAAVVQNPPEIRSNEARAPGGGTAAAAFALLDQLIRPSARIAIATGSRGIDHLAPIIREMSDYVQARRAHPFIVPAMGSHGGATAEGQDRF